MRHFRTGCLIFIGVLLLCLILFISSLISCSPTQEGVEVFNFDNTPAAIKRGDIKEIRKVFQVPDSAKLALYQTDAPEAGWFGREGQKIITAFQFSQTDYQAFQKSHQNDALWHSLPAPQELLLKSEDVEATFEILKIPAQTLKNPTKDPQDIHYPRWVKLHPPLNIHKGAYKCLTAGNNLMHDSPAFPKVDCLKKPGHLIDFMLGFLDDERHTLTVIAHSQY